MDAKHLDGIEISEAELPIILPRPVPRAPERVESRQPSQVLHALLAAGWLVFLWSIGLFSGVDENAAPIELSALEQALMPVLLATIFGVFAVVVLALANSSATARLSAICGFSMAAIGATCGLEGHAISAWGPSAGAAAALGLASVAMMRRNV